MTVTTTDRLIHTDPIIEDRYSGNRAIDYKWLLLEEPVTDHFDRPMIRRVHVVLTVEHNGKQGYGVRDPLSYTAELHHDDFNHGDGFTMTTIAIGQPCFRLQIGKEPTARFSRKRLETFGEEMLVALRNRRDDDNIRRAFGEEA